MMAPKAWQDVRDSIRPWSVWQHVKTEGRYTVLGIARRTIVGPSVGDFVVGMARCSTNGKDEGKVARVYFDTSLHRLMFQAPDEEATYLMAVVYNSHARGWLNYRELAEFCDGRFVSVERS